MIKIVVGGATGRLGSLVCALIQQQQDMARRRGLGWKRQRRLRVAQE